MNPRSPRSFVAVLVALLLAALLLGVGACAVTGGVDAPALPLRISDAREEGDPARRASVRLVLEGLEADAGGRFSRARGLYDRALQVDPTNPYAYLALARHQAEGVEPSRAIAYLEQAERLFEQQGGLRPEVTVHLEGLRGSVDYATGRVEQGVERLERARELAPRIWSDGKLEAFELR